ncbi:MAG: non-ribosomal peptide synthetase, partial [Lysobacteraceae bacterium]
LDLDALQATLDAIVDRHEILRTSYRVTDDGEPHQVIHAPTPLRIGVMTGSSTEEGLRAQVAAEAMQPFDLGSGPMLRASLLRLGDADHVLLMTMHHIASDGTSMGVLIDEFVQLYAAFADGGENPLPPLSVQYADFAQWQHGWLQGETLERQLSYWTRQLAGIPSLHGLPTDKPRPALQSFTGATLRRPIDQALRTQLQALGQAHGATLFMTLQAAFAALLARYGNETDIVIGTPIANRAHPALASVIGLFVNTLVLRNEVSMEASFATLLERTRQLALDAYEHQDVPFEMLVTALRPERRLSHSPVFQVMFALQENVDTELALPDLRVDTVDIGYQVAKFDLTLTIDTTADGLLGSWQYCADLFEADTIARLAESFEQLLRAVVARPEQPVGNVPLMTPAEQRRVLANFNDVPAEKPSGALIHQQFEACVAANPEATAVIFESQSLSYAELNERANRLAHYLIAQGVRPDDRVAICVERGLDMIVGLLGILKSGAGYVPLDPAHPPERQAFMLADSAPRILLTQQTLRDRVCGDALPALMLDGAGEELAPYSTQNPEARDLGITPRHLAYVIYTSGSTGQPKGVMVEHASVINLWASLEKAIYHGLPADARVGLNAPITFDGSLKPLVQLLSGRTLVVIPQAARLDPSLFLRYARQHRIEAFDCTPTHLDALIKEGLLDETSHPSLKLAVVGGEAINGAVWKTLQASRSLRFHNVYGPTECTVNATQCALSEAGELPIIGRPIANTRSYILDPQGAPVPIGVVGELHIGGAGVARGYLNRAELTAERFLRDPFSDAPSARMYRTGDLARWLPDGNIEFLGRNDFQVKIRGFRIELGEIEARLAACAGVREAVVLAREDSPGNKRLVAYFTAVAGAQVSTEGLRSELRDQLPDYMVPSVFVMLDTFALTANGKLDRKALPMPDSEALDRREYEAPHTGNEVAIAEIWRQLLGVSRVGRHDNFFDLGGHSLLATRMVSALRQRFDLEIPLREVFNLQTVSELSAYIDEESELAHGLDGVVSNPASKEGQHSSAEVWEL